MCTLVISIHKLASEMDIREYYEYVDGDLICKKWYVRRIKVGDRLGGKGMYAKFNDKTMPIYSWVFFYFNGRFPRKVLYADGSSSNTRIENIVEMPDLEPLTKEWARFHFIYDNGKLISRFSRRSFESGRVCGTITKKGYISVAVDSKPYLAHRVVWSYFNGTPRSETIDHVNGNRSDNRIDNLREATFQQNTRNRKNASGVTYVAKAKKWQAQITVGGKTKYLGLFAKKSEALSARREAEIKYFGVFAK